MIINVHTFTTVRVMQCKCYKIEVQSILELNELFWYCEDKCSAYFFNLSPTVLWNKYLLHEIAFFYRSKINSHSTISLESKSLFDFLNKLFSEHFLLVILIYIPENSLENIIVLVLNIKCWDPKCLSILPRCFFIKEITLNLLPEKYSEPIMNSPFGLSNHFWSFSS